MVKMDGDDTPVEVETRVDDASDVAGADGGALGSVNADGAALENVNVGDGALVNADGACVGAGFHYAFCATSGGE